MSVDYDALRETLAGEINKPVQVSTDAGSVSMAPLSERYKIIAQLEEDEAAANADTANRNLIKFQRFKMPGATLPT